MAITAENVAERHQVTRQEQDELAVEGHQRAAGAIAEGRFKEQILPIEVKTRKGIGRVRHRRACPRRHRRWKRWLA